MMDRGSLVFGYERIPYCEPHGYRVLGQGMLEEVKVKDLFSRLMRAVGAQSELQLVSILGIRLEWLNDAKMRNIAPCAWIVRAANEWGFSPEWILTGNGKEHLAEELFKSFD